MSGSATFELVEQDHVNAVQAHTGRIVGKLSWALLFVTLLFPAVDLWAGVSIMEDGPFWFFLTLTLIFFIWDWIARDWIVRRAFRQGEAMHTPIRIDWDDEAIRFHTEMSDSRYDWSRFYRWRCTEKSLLLYRDSQFFIVIPRRALNGADADDIVGSLREAGVRER